MTDFPTDADGWPIAPGAGRFAGADRSERRMGGTAIPLSRIAKALTASAAARSRLSRWKNQAGMATAARGGFPYPHRTVATVDAAHWSGR